VGVKIFFIADRVFDKACLPHAAAALLRVSR
jgi:hypothetical protein